MRGVSSLEENKIPLLQVENLSTYFHMFNGTVKAVDGISFSLAQGEILGIVGESGSGKSVSSFSIIGLVDEPGEVRADRILFNGRDLTRVSEQELMDLGLDLQSNAILWFSDMQRTFVSRLPDDLLWAMMGGF